MDASTPPDQLEARLRSMILGNSQPNSSQTDPPSGQDVQPQHARRGSQGSRRYGHQRASSRGNHMQQASWQSESHLNHSTARPHPNRQFQRGSSHQQPSQSQSSRGAGRGAQATPQYAPQNQNRSQRGSFNNSRGTSRYKLAQIQRPGAPPENLQLQCQFLEDVASVHLPNFEMPEGEYREKDLFRVHLQQVLQRAVNEAFPDNPSEIALQPFGSLSSGFAMPGSDMDLALRSTIEHPDIFRVFQRALLDIDIGARVLSRTRVPILKICEQPTPEILQALRDDRELWDKMTPEERDAHDDGRPIEKKETRAKDGDRVNTGEETTGKTSRDPEGDGETPLDVVESGLSAVSITATSPMEQSKSKSKPSNQRDVTARQDQSQHSAASEANDTTRESGGKDEADKDKTRQARKERPWYREKRLGPLDYPKTGVGIQCDINYENPLGIHNTLLLRCYSHVDVRVRLMVLFIKGWASKRKINSSYNGTLSSYGYVLMVLHYLVNVAHPPVCPNLQLHHISRVSEGRRSAPPLDPADPNQVCQGFDVRFWRSEQEIISLAGRQMLTHNRDSLGTLLRGFFRYYAQQGANVPEGGFTWTQQVLSLRTRGGILTKAAKGWTGATTTVLNTDGTSKIVSTTAKAVKEPKKDDAAAPPIFTHGALAAPAPPGPALSSETQSPPSAQAAATTEAKEKPPEPLPHGAREVRNRYLFAIEDPFEVSHNVARTVTHNGIVAIRDEFRRVWRILQATGRGQVPHDGDLMEAVESVMPPLPPAADEDKTSQKEERARLDMIAEALVQQENVQAVQS